MKIFQQLVLVAALAASTTGTATAARLRGSRQLASSTVYAELPTEFYNGFIKDCDAEGVGCPFSSRGCTDVAKGYDPANRGMQLGCKLATTAGILPQGVWSLSLPLDTRPQEAMGGFNVFSLRGIIEMIHDGCYQMQFHGTTDETRTEYYSESEYKASIDENTSFQASGSAEGNFGIASVAVHASYTKETERSMATGAKNTYMSATLARQANFGTLTNKCIANRRAERYIDAAVKKQWEDMQEYAPLGEGHLDNAKMLSRDPQFQQLVSRGLLIPQAYSFAVGISRSMVFESSVSSADSTEKVRTSVDGGIKASYGSFASADAQAAMESTTNAALKTSGSTTRVRVREHTFGSGTCDWTHLFGTENTATWRNTLQGCAQDVRADIAGKLGFPERVSTFAPLTQVMPWASDTQAMSKTFQEALEIYLYHCNCDSVGDITNDGATCYLADGSPDTTPQRSSQTCTMLSGFTGGAWTTPWRPDMYSPRNNIEAAHNRVAMCTTPVNYNAEPFSFVDHPFAWRQGMCDSVEIWERCSTNAECNIRGPGVFGSPRACTARHDDMLGMIKRCRPSAAGASGR